MSFDLNSMIETLNNDFPGSITGTVEYRGETTVLVKKSNISGICRTLKESFGFTFLAELTAVDYLEIKTPRFEVVYYVHRFGPEYDENVRIKLKTAVSDDDPTINSVTPIWRGADWLEREVYDMFGIEFVGHPDLRRILLPEDYEPFPLRKDFDVRDRESSKRSYERALEQDSE